MKTPIWIKKFGIYVGALSILISIIALFIGIRSCSISNGALEENKKANKISNEALQLAKISFELEHRPFIRINPATFKENNAYFKISDNEKELIIELNIMIENKGKIPAKEIHIKEDAYNSRLGSIPSTFTRPKDLSIPPDDEYCIVFQLKLQKKLYKKSSSNAINDLTSGKGSILIPLDISYMSDLDITKKYRSYTSYEFRYKEAKILDSAFE